MANVFLFEPGNIDAPQWSVEELEKNFGSINLYSFYSDRFWAGTGGFGEEIDFLYEGYGLSQGTDAGQLTGITTYVNGSAVISIDEFDVPVSDLVNYTPGKPLAQLGFFNGSDYMSGSYGNDVLKGYTGNDDIWGDSGDDLIHGGNGADIVWGAEGSDTLHGDFGRNTFQWEDDGAVDTLHIKSDQWMYNWLLESTGNNPEGQRIDTIYALDPFDKIIIEGVSTDKLSFAMVDGGIGIFADGYLEATYTGGDLTTSQLDAMTTGLIA